MSELDAPDISGPMVDRWDRIVKVVAYGGTRRERGATIAAWVRHNGGSGRLRLVSIRHDEAYGFQSGTFARYERKT
jgi:hypothetical protein